LLYEWFGAAEEENTADAEEHESEVEGPDRETLEAEHAEWEKTVANLQSGLEQAKKDKDKEKSKKLKAQVREAEKKLTEVTKTLKRLSLKGRVELLVEEPKALE